VQILYTFIRSSAAPELQGAGSILARDVQLHFSLLLPVMSLKCI
jgi:hypothetical protein